MSENVKRKGNAGNGKASSASRTKLIGLVSEALGIESLQADSNLVGLKDGQYGDQSINYAKANRTYL